MSLKQEMKLNQDLNQYSFGFSKIKIQNGSIIYITINKDLLITLMRPYHF